MTSTLRVSPKAPTINYTANQAFNGQVYSYSYEFARGIGILTPVQVSAINAPAGVTLRDTGRTLHPARNNGVSVPMVSVSFVGAQDGQVYTGYINPLDALFFTITDAIPIVRPVITNSRKKCRSCGGGE